MMLTAMLQRQHRRHEPRKTFGVFEPDGPADFHQTGDEQNDQAMTTLLERQGRPRGVIGLMGGRPPRSLIWGSAAGAPQSAKSP